MQKTGDNSYMDLLDPETVSTLRRLEMIAGGVKEGFVTGRHASPFHGFSVEFAEHREYTPGDNIRDINWRAWAKSDRYYIKQYIDETNLRSMILLDASGSMSYTGSAASQHKGRRLSKFEYGSRLAASLAYLMINQQDAVGLATFDNRLRRYLPARSRAGHLRVMLEELHNTRAGGETSLAPILHHIADRISRRGLVVIISDLFDNAEEIIKALHHFRFRKHEVIVMHVMAEEELAFTFDRWSTFHDLEVAGRKFDLDPNSVKAAYLAEVRKFLKDLEKGCGQMEVDYVQLSTKNPFDVALASYLAHRKNRLRKR